MDTVPWLLTLLATGFWIGLVLEHLRDPPERPRGWSLRARRTGWLVVAVASLAGGAWGPQLWSRTTSDFPRDAPRGDALGLEERGSTLRTPFAVRTRTHVVDRDGQWVRSEGTVALQLPVLLLTFFGVVGWVRLWEGRSQGGAMDPGAMDPGADP